MCTLISLVAFLARTMASASSNSLLESTATFRQQAMRAGLTEPWIESFKNSGFDRMSTMAYAVTTPGSSPSSEQIQEFLFQIRPGTSATLSELTAVKRLIFEAQTYTVASLRSSVMTPDDSSNKRIAPAERTSRIEAQKQRLQGLDLTGPLEPSFWLYDACTGIMESGEVKYISPQKCLTRQQELVHDRPQKELRLDSSKGGLIVKDQMPMQDADIGTDLALFQAMQRRALAMDLVGLATYSVSMRFINRLFSLMVQDPAPGYQKPGHVQLLRADRQSFLRLAEMTHPPFGADPSGRLPLDNAIDILHNDVSVTYHMLPIASRHKDDVSNRPASGSNKPVKQSTGKQSATSKDRGQGKAGGKSKRQPMPEALKGMHHKTPSGKAICFNYNLGKCQDKSCQRSHVCCHPGCYKSHPQFEHDSA